MLQYIKWRKIPYPTVYLRSTDMLYVKKHTMLTHNYSKHTLRHELLSALWIERKVRPQRSLEIRSSVSGLLTTKSHRQHCWLLGCCDGSTAGQQEKEGTSPSLYTLAPSCVNAIGYLVVLPQKNFKTCSSQHTAR